MTTKKREQEFSVNVEAKVPATRIADLLIGALEGGSNYWVETVTLGPEVSGFGSARPSADDYYPRSIRYPLSGGYVKIHTTDDEPMESHTLDLAAIKRGLDLMARLYPKDFNDFMQENDDANTADMFLQLAVLGEIVYS